MEWRSHQEDLLERDPGHNEQSRCIECGKRNTFAGSDCMVLFKAKCIHRFHRLCFPVGNDIRIEFIQPEMPADVDVEIVFISLITKQRV